jgi:hypothetical protein
MVHPCDGEAWHQFDNDYPDFALDRRNVRLAVATDGFTPFNLNDAPYSCWPVFVIPLNLPPGTLLSHEYIFLSLVVPGPEHAGKKLNILMQPSVDELQELWVGVNSWDALVKKKIKLREAYLWSIHDFMAYGDFARWSTHGRLACPYGYGCKGFTYVMVTRLAGLIATGCSCLLIMNLDNKQTDSVRTLGFFMSLLVA